MRAREAVEALEGLDDDERAGAQIVARALEHPLRWIVQNAGFEAGIVVERETGSVGFNAATGQFEDLLKAGVIDPAKVTRAALQNAASIAAMVLTTETLVTDIPEKQAAAAGGGHGHGGGDMDF